MVEDQFVEMRKETAEMRREMALQLTRMGQIQAQLDLIQKMLKKLIDTDA